MSTLFVAHAKEQQAREIELQRKYNNNNSNSNNKGNCNYSNDNCNDQDNNSNNSNSSSNNNNNDNNNKKMSRKDDPVFNVRFVQLVENHPCLWKSTHPGYSKKEEIQKAWQFVANETKDTVRNCRERWRTIRSSFLRSLKLSRTQTGRGKRKYYLSKYLQFLMPYTKTRLKGGSNLMVLRRLTTSSMGAAEASAVLAAAAVAAGATSSSATTTSAAAAAAVVAAAAINSLQPPPMTCISNMPMPYGGNSLGGGGGVTAVNGTQSCDEHTKDSMAAGMMGINENHIEDTSSCGAASLAHSSGGGGGGNTGFPPRLRAIKLEQVNSASGAGSGGGGGIVIGREQTADLATSMANGFLAAADHQCNQTMALAKTNAVTTPHLLPHVSHSQSITQLSSKSNGIDWVELAEWMRTKNNEYHRRCLIDSKNDSPTLGTLPAATAAAATTSSLSSSSASASTISIGGSNSNQNHNQNHHHNNQQLQLMAMSAAAAASATVPQSMPMPALSTAPHPQPHLQQQLPPPTLPSISALPSDAEQMFLNSLHPFLKEMTGKQNRRFRQKVIALIDAILDDVDVVS